MLEKKFLKKSLKNRRHNGGQWEERMCESCSVVVICSRRATVDQSRSSQDKHLIVLIILSQHNPKLIQMCKQVESGKTFYKCSQMPELNIPSKTKMRSGHTKVAGLSRRETSLMFELQLKGNRLAEQHACEDRSIIGLNCRGLVTSVKYTK